MQINVTDYWLKHLNDKTFCKKIALVESENKFSFGDLFNASGKLADWLIKNFPDIEKPVAVFLPKSAELIVADIAIIYSGNAYMNLDTKQPVKRTENILKHIQPAYIISHSKFKKFFEELSLKNFFVIYVDELSLEDYDIEIIKSRLEFLTDTSPLCIVNTSGSTGTPKGVVMNHRSVIDFMDSCLKALPIAEPGIIGSLSPAYFDIFTMEFFLMLWLGYKFVIIPEFLATFPEKLVGYLEDKQIDFIFWVPTIMVNIANLDILSKHKIPHLKNILFAGEVFPQKHLEYWWTHLRSAKFVNMYGPIEITVDCLYHICNGTGY